MTKQNLHTHSNYDDGHDSIEQMIEKAIELGFDSIGFSGHGTNRPLDTCSMTSQGQQDYIQDVKKAARKYKSKIDVFLGIEQDHVSPVDDGLFDYVISSVHYLPVTNGFMAVDASRSEFDQMLKQEFKSNIKNLVKTYYDQMMIAVSDPKADIVGHLDLVSKFNENQEYFDFEDPEIIAMAVPVIEKAIENDLIFEINTGAIARGYRTLPYPHPVLLKEIQKRSGKITISSDCHNRENLDCARKMAVELARKAGFKTIWIKTENGFEEEPVD